MYIFFFVWEKFHISDSLAFTCQKQVHREMGSKANNVGWEGEKGYVCTEVKHNGLTKMGVIILGQGGRTRQLRGKSDN